MRIGKTVKVTQSPKRNIQKVRKQEEQPIPVKLPDKAKTNVVPS